MSCGITFFFKLTKPAKLCKPKSVSLEVVETEIRATEELLKKYRNNVYDSALTCACEIAEVLQMWKAEPEKRRMYEYETENKICEMSQKDQFKANFFLPFIEYAVCCSKDRFEKMHTVCIHTNAIFDILYNQENLLQHYEHNCLPSSCHNFYKTVGDIESMEMNYDRELFVVIVRKTKNI